MIFFCQDELQRTNLELDSFREKIKENQEKIKLNKQLPYLVGNIVEVFYLILSSFREISCPLYSFLVLTNFGTDCLFGT